MPKPRTMYAPGGDIASMARRVPGVFLVSNLATFEDGAALAAYEDSNVRLVVRFRAASGWIRPKPARFEVDVDRGAWSAHETHPTVIGAIQAIRRFLP